jgi:hypothetical protein
MDSIREALTAAFDKAETNTPDPSKDAVDETTTNAAAVDSPELPADTVDEAAAPSEGVDGGETIPSKDGTPAAAAPVAPESPAPASWNNEERAAWNTVPAKAREAIARRESEMSRALQSSSSARKRVEALEKIAQPYAPLLNSYGITVEQAMPGLLATRAALEVGTPEQKAELVANICADFGIEVELLDGALSKRYQHGTPTPRVAPQQIDFRNSPELAPLYAMAEQFKTAQTERAQQAIAAVSSDPHYDSVRHTMADLIDKAREQGRTLDLPVALNLAKQFHGIAVPAAAPSVSDAARTLAAARNAAASVSGAPKPSAPRKPGEGSLRDELEANFSARR